MTLHTLSIAGLAAGLRAKKFSSVEPMAHPLDMSQRLRPDAVTESNRREEFQAHAPSVKHGLYIVPKVIE